MVDARRRVKGSLQIDATYIAGTDLEQNVSCLLALSAAGPNKLALRIDGRMYLVKNDSLRALSIAANDVWGR